MNRLTMLALASWTLTAGQLWAEPQRSGYAVEGGRMVYGPVVYENLGVFIITGEDKLKGAADYVTLDEAIKNEWVIVHETGNVNQLTVENITPGRTVVILAGAVVKGGKQDRVLGTDLILKPQSGKIPIASFCVEQSRWRRRGNEMVDRFNSSSIQVSGKALRKAVKGGLSQQDVWKNVAEEQKKISQNVREDVQANASPTSFQLATENRELQKEVSRYRKALQEIDGRYPDAIGYAVTVNGEFSTADVYASHQLFRKMWPQHLASAITEAVSLKDQAKTGQKIDLAWRDAIFDEKSYEQKQQRQTGGENAYVASQNRRYFRYQCVLPQQDQLSIRLSYEARGSQESLVPLEQAGVQTDSPVNRRTTKSSQRDDGR